jgi:hypothetical protein
MILKGNTITPDSHTIQSHFRYGAVTVILHACLRITNLQ